MTWLEFKTEVLKFLTVDSVRLGTVPDLREQLIRQAVVDLQSYVVQMRFPHQTIYTVADLTVDGFASVGTLPDQAIPHDMYYVKDNDIPNEENNECARSPVENYPWQNRYDLICGAVPISGCQYKIAMSPQAESFYVFPKLADDHHLSLFWEGQRIDFVDATVVPFGERSIMAVAMWVKAGIIREVDRDPAMALAYMGTNARQPGTYLYLRSMCYLDGRDRLRFSGSKAAPQGQTGCANTTVCTPLPLSVV